MHALARHLARGASVVVCDPDAIAGSYPGYRVVGAGDDDESIGRALTLASNEVARRRDQRKQGQREFPPMWVLIDEAHDIFGSVEGARDIAEGIIRRGRKLEVHCVLGTQDAQVRTLGLSGKSELLKNLLRVDVRRAGNGREAVIEGEPWRVPELPSPDEMVRVMTHKNHQRPPDEEDLRLLWKLLTSNPGQPEGRDHLSGRPVQTSPGPSEGRDHFSGSPLETNLPDHQEILSKLAELGSKNKVWQFWLRPQYGIARKERGFEIINAALEAAEEE